MHFYNSQLGYGHFSGSALSFEVAFPILFPLSSGRIERTCFSSLNYSNKKNISFAFIWTFWVFWKSLGIGMNLFVWFGLVWFSCKTVVLKRGPWPATSVSLGNLLKVQILILISDLLNQKVWILVLAICFWQVLCVILMHT